MKKITLLIADNVYKELRGSQMFRMMLDNSFGIQDEFIKKILSSIENNEKEVEIKYKDKEDAKDN